MSLDELVRSGPPTAYVVRGDGADVVALQHALEGAHADTTFVQLHGAKMRTAAGFFAELAAALQLPAWFGGNWNALVDVARDRTWLAGHVLAIHDGHELLIDASDRDRRDCAEVLELLGRGGRDPASAPRDDPDDDHGFHLLAQLPADEAEAFIARWRAAGLTIAPCAPSAW